MRRSSLYPIEKKVLSYWPDSRKAIVAISGGADSVALLHILCKLTHNKIIAAHCNFGLRGLESLRDEMFVRNLCDRLDIPLYVKKFDVERYIADNKGISVEMACRELRYTWFDELSGQLGGLTIMVAHNADDNIETLMLNLFRGCGVSGLSGMKISSGNILRPLLKATRKEILTYLKEIGENYIVDSSNLKSEYRRNFIRNELLPLIETRWPGVRKALSNTQEILAHQEDIIASVLKPSEKSFLSKDEILSSIDPLTIIFTFIKPLGGNSAIASEMLRNLLSLSSESKIWKMTGGWVEKEREGLRCHLNSDRMSSPLMAAKIDLLLPDILERIGRRNDVILLPDGPARYEWRMPRPGDRIKPMGMSGNTKVAKVLKDAKLSAYQKSCIRLLVNKLTGDIIWIEGLKRSSLDLVDKDSEIFIAGEREGIIKLFTEMSEKLVFLHIKQDSNDK